MTAYNKIRKQILLDVCDEGNPIWSPEDITEENIDEIWGKAGESSDYSLGDFKEEFRYSGFDADIKCEWSRHYESKSIAKQVWDGSWVGWTYWYGGGKHGEPSAIDWMEDAYFVTMEEKLEPVKYFTKA